MRKKTVNIDVPVLARVEGEGALHITVGSEGIEKLQLNIFEPPRFFEKLLAGRDFMEVTDIVTRICGICPVAYQISAVQAMEDLFAVDVGSWVRDMRRVFYCGEWIESHCLHMHLLAAPDFLGYNSVVEMAVDHAEVVRRGLKLQGLGNDLIKLFGARSVNPVGVRPGGFYRAPDLSSVQQLCGRLQEALPEAFELLRWVSTIELPEVQQEFISVAMKSADSYAITHGDIVSSTGLVLSAAEYDRYFVESHVAHSTALHSLLDGKPYLVGPLARMNLNYAQLRPEIRQALRECAVDFPSNNMFHSIVARAAETCQAIMDSIEILQAYELPATSYVPVAPQAGVGYGASEAPRGLLWHRYEFDQQGLVRHARIVPPTSQNQARIEQDIGLTLAAMGLGLPDEDLRLTAEKVIRNYDPCISCATHFLDLRVSRS